MLKKQPTSERSTVELQMSLRQGYMDFNAGKLRLAEVAARNSLAADNANPDALHLLGLVAHSAGKTRDAVALLKAACRAVAAPPIFFSNLAEMLRLIGEVGESEAAARQALRINPSLGPAWNNLGIVLQETGRLDQSRHCLEKAVTLQPDSAEYQNNLANTLQRQGLHSLADEHWANALKLKPDYAQVYSNRALMLSDQCRFDEAVASGLRAVELNPKLTDAYVSIAAAETARQRFELALQWLQRGFKAAPSTPASLAALGLALKSRDRLDDAEGLLVKAVENHPSSPELQNSLGLVLQARGNLETALSAYEKAIALPSNTRERAMNNRAVLLMEHGRKAEAKAAFIETLAAFPRSAAAYFNAADLEKYEADDPAIGAMEELLQGSPPVSANERMMLGYALGKAYLDLGDSHEAFKHLDAANATKRKSISYSAAASDAYFSRIAETFSSHVLQSQSSGIASDAPIFIVGMPRSGTTLVEQILASHPSVVGAGELKYVQHQADKVGGYPETAAALSQSELRDLGNSYLASVAKLSKGRAHVLDKMPANFIHIGFIHMMLPNAKFIHLMRNPVDTCLSCYSKHFAAEQFFTYDQAELGKFYQGYATLMKHWRPLMPKDRFIEVQYEAVVDDLEGQARRLVSFLGLPWDPACIEFHRTERPVRTASLNQVRQPIYATSKGRWKKHEAQLGPLIDALKGPDGKLVAL